jgi:hypothetical protein
MVRKNYIELDKITLAWWVDKALNLTFIKNKSSQGSKVQGFGHLTLRPWIKKLTLVLYTHYRIRPRKKKN